MEIINQALFSQVEVFLYEVFETFLEFLHVMCLSNVCRLFVVAFSSIVKTGADNKVSDVLTCAAAVER